MLTRIRHAYHVLGIVDKSDLTNHVFDQPPSRKKSYRFSFRITRAWLAAPRPRISMLSQGDHDGNQPQQRVHIGLTHLSPCFLLWFPLCLLPPTTLRFGVQG